MDHRERICALGRESSNPGQIQAEGWQQEHGGRENLCCCALGDTFLDRSLQLELHYLHTMTGNTMKTLSNDRSLRNSGVIPALCLAPSCPKHSG